MVVWYEERFFPRYIILLKDNLTFSVKSAYHVVLPGFLLSLSIVSLATTLQNLLTCPCEAPREKAARWAKGELERRGALGGQGETRRASPLWSKGNKKENLLNGAAAASKTTAAAAATATNIGAGAAGAGAKASARQASKSTLFFK